MLYPKRGRGEVSRVTQGDTTTVYAVGKDGLALSYVKAAASAADKFAAGGVLFLGSGAYAYLKARRDAARGFIQTHGSLTLRASNPLHFDQSIQRVVLVSIGTMIVGLTFLGVAATLAIWKRWTARA